MSNIREINILHAGQAAPLRIRNLQTKTFCQRLGQTFDSLLNFQALPFPPVAGAAPIRIRIRFRIRFHNLINYGKLLESCFRQQQQLQSAFNSRGNLPERCWCRR